MIKRSRRIAAALCALAVTFSCMSPLGAAAYELGELQTAGLELFAAGDSVEINAVNFPDETFREYVKKFDTDGSGGFSQAELDAVTEIDVSGTYKVSNTVADLTGVEYFTKMTSLNCSYNQLTSLDVSKNTALKYLYCGSNQLTSLNVGNNTSMDSLSCEYNQLTSLEVSKTTALKYLNCDSNQLTSLDVSKNTALTELNCKFNQLTSLDVSKNTSLESLSCGYNQLTSLDVSNNTALEYLYCSSNQLTSLDVGNNTSLDYLSYTGNPYSIGDVNGSFSLSSLPKGFDPEKASKWTGATYDKATNTLKNFTSNTVTYTYDCGSGKSATFKLIASSVTTPDVVEINAVNFPDETFREYVKQFDTDGSGGFSQAELDAVTEIDVSGTYKVSNTVADLTGVEYFTKMTSLRCDYNQLTSLDVSNNTSLESLSCEYNQLTSLDVSKNTALGDLTCTDNTYSIGDVNGSFSLSSLPAGFDPEKASEWTGATYDKATNSLKNFTSKTVTYKYDCGNGKSAKFTLIASSIYTAPAKPAFTSLTSGVNSVSLKWSAVEGAASYRVFYRLNGTSKWTYKNTASTAMTVTGLTGGKVYDFLVRSYDGSAWSSYTASDIKTATPKAVSKPSFTSLTPGVNSVVLRWNAVEGAKSYRVFYRISGTSKWTYKNTTKNAMNLTGLTGGKKYDFLVRSYNGSAWSTYAASDIRTATPKASNKPVIYSAVPGVNSVVLRWNAVSGAKSYRVYYRVSGTSKWSYKNTTKNAMNLTGLTGGKTYEFVVRSYNGSTWTAFTSADIVKAAVKTNI